MQIFRSRPVAAVAMAAALSLTATPAFARGGWGHRHNHDRIDGGDVLAGLLVIGGIAAIASAASNSKKNKEQREADYRDPDGPYRDRDYRADDDGRYVPPADNRDAPSYGYRAGNLDGAVDSCVSEVERGRDRVDSVDNVSRDGEGWRVTGRAGGRDFSCSVDRDGRIGAVTVDGRAPYN